MITTIAVTQAVKTLKEAHKLFNLQQAGTDFFTEHDPANNLVRVGQIIKKLTDI